mmetsp:Transcript_22372/g.55260  ORF Transcript_22372/g.55260 Transcript_22372/m.55260 type:complete len:307 (-) Transcript_22372:52-972(-)
MALEAGLDHHLPAGAAVPERLQVLLRRRAPRGAIQRVPQTPVCDGLSPYRRRRLAARRRHRQSHGVHGADVRGGAQALRPQEPREYRPHAHIHVLGSGHAKRRHLLPVQHHCRGAGGAASLLMLVPALVLSVLLVARPGARAPLLPVLPRPAFRPAALLLPIPRPRSRPRSRAPALFLLAAAFGRALSVALAVLVFSLAVSVAVLAAATTAATAAASLLVLTPATLCHPLLFLLLRLFVASFTSPIPSLLPRLLLDRRLRPLLRILQKCGGRRPVVGRASFVTHIAAKGVRVPIAGVQPSKLVHHA